MYYRIAGIALINLVLVVAFTGTMIWCSKHNTVAWPPSKWHWLSLASLGPLYWIVCLWQFRLLKAET